MRGSLVRRARHWVANRGVGGALAEFLRRVPLLLRSFRAGRFEERQVALSRPAVHPFDTQYGVDTSGLIWGERLAAAHPNRYWATGYYGISPSVFWQAMDRVNVQWGRFTFIDVGSGKGRALMLAQRYPFRRIIGLEISPDLVRISSNNVQRFQAAWGLPATVEIVPCDAADFALPLGPCVLFLYHPFARPVMTKFVQHLRASLREHPREMYLIYANPELHDIVVNSGSFIKLWDEFFAVAAEDFTADFFGSDQEHIAVYRSL